MSDNVEIRRSIDPAIRASIATLGEALIPAAHGMPAASEMDVGGRQLDVVLASRPDLAGPILDVLGDLNVDDPEAALAHLRRDQPAGYDAVVLAIVAGYYMHPEVHRLIGYPGQVPKDVQRMSEREIYQDGLMDLAAKVIERGPIYRPTPDPPS